MYIGIYPNSHPVFGNSSWSQMELGADSITLQYDNDIAPRCSAGASSRCAIFVGVFGWVNSR